jgi:hypothetical protein
LRSATTSRREDKQKRIEANKDIFVEMNFRAEIFKRAGPANLNTKQMIEMRSGFDRNRRAFKMLGPRCLDHNDSAESK